MVIHLCLLRLPGLRARLARPEALKRIARPSAPLDAAYMKMCLACQQPFVADDWHCPSCGFAPSSQGGILRFAPEVTHTGEGFDPTYFEELFRLEAGSFWFRSRNRLLTWALRTYLPHASTYLEIGCGTGFVLSGFHAAFPGLLMHGSDIFSEGLAFAGQRVPEAVLLQMDAKRLPFDREFDAIGAFDVLEHVDEDEVVLSQMFRATKPGGGILVTVPQHRFLWSIVDEQGFHKRRYSRAELTGKVEQAGFRVVRVTSFVSLLLPLMLLSRLKRQVTRAPRGPSAELDIGKALNQLLEGVLNVERTMIEGSVSFPAGGSLLLVARRDAE